VRLLERLGTAWRYASGQRLVELLTKQPPPPLGAIAGKLVSGEGSGGSGISRKEPDGPVFATKPEPLGWLGALVAHGGTCMAFEIAYMTTKKYGTHYHLLPNLGGDWDNTSGDAELFWASTNLMTNRFREYPCPVYPRSGPTFLLGSDYGPYEHNGGTADKWRAAIDYRAGIGEVAHLINWGPDAERWLTGTRTDTAPDDWGIRVDSSGYLIHKGNRSGATWQRVYPGRRVADWATETAVKSTTSKAYRIGRDRGFITTPMMLMSTAGIDYRQRPVWVPPYYRTSTKRLHDFYRRLLKWYYTARWLVWAADMMRIHSGHKQPSWWQAHALSWAIDSAGETSTALTRWSYMDVESDLRVKDLSTAQLDEILRAVVKHTPPPGKKGATGQQIAPEGSPLTLCDIPDEAGSVVPPIAILDDSGDQLWATYAVYKFKKHTELWPWLNWYGPIVDALISIAGSGAGGALTAGIKAVAGAAMSALATQLVCYVATYALQAIVALGRGKLTFDGGDIVALVSTAFEASGLGDEALKNLPPGMWDALKTAGAAIPEVAGADWQETLPELMEIQSRLSDLKWIRKWNYLDAAYGGLGLSGDIAGQPAFDPLH
jgi:hypothetical protein